MGTRFLVPQDGTLRDGYFYIICFTNSDEYLPGDRHRKDEIYESPLPHGRDGFDFTPVPTFMFGSGFKTEEEEEAWRRDRSNYMVWSPDEQKRLLCPIDPKHDEKWTRTLHECISIADSRTDAQRAERRPAFALMQTPSMGYDGEKIISKRLADRMDASGLKGGRYKSVKAVRFSEGSGIPANFKSTISPAYDTDLVSLIFTGTPCTRKRKFVDGPNACPFCGFKPLVCEACGYVVGDCPQCDEYPFKANAAGVPGIEMASGNNSRLIIDGQFWDGSDMVCGRNQYRDRVVTRRFVEWLLAIDAAPFVALPIPVCVDGMTADQVDMLEKARDVHSLLK